MDPDNGDAGDEYGGYGDEDEGEGWGDYGDDDDEYQIKDVEQPKLGTKKSSYSVDKRPYKPLEAEDQGEVAPVVETAMGAVKLRSRL